ncbi:hypothetical protein ACEN8K_37830 [Variovorax sp. CT11-76]
MEASHQAAFLAVVVGGFAQHLAAGRELARQAVHVALGVERVLLREPAVLVDAHQAHEDAVLDLFLAQQLAAAAVLAAQHAGLARGLAAVGGVDRLAVELAVLRRARGGRAGEQQRQRCGQGQPRREPRNIDRPDRSVGHLS